MTIYNGDADGTVWVVQGKKRVKLDKRTDVFKQSTTFGWGNTLAASRQLAFALLCEEFDESDARNYYMRFTHRFVALLGKGQAWSTNSKKLAEIVEEIKHADQLTQMQKRFPAKPPAPERVYGRFSDVGDGVIWDAEHDRRK